MNMKNAFIIGIGIILIAAVGFVGFKFLNKPTQTNSTQTSSMSQSNSTSSGSTETKNINNIYTMSEVAKHNNINDCWLVIQNKVYDVTSFIPQHPGGNEILKGCGKDATSMFERQPEHQENNAASYLPTYEIGSIQ